MTQEHAFTSWIGRTETLEDLVASRLLREFDATLAPLLWSREDAAPPCIHWCLAPPAAPLAELGGDGHPRKGGFLPPIPLPRRMWAGGELAFHDDLRAGDEVRRVSTISGIEHKRGRTGDLWFVEVSHEVSTRRGVAVSERQTIVYRPAEAPASVPPPPAVSREEADVVREVDTASVRLFRYSALTFNGHRIHYDFPYATQVEGYAGLVVHGPMQATLLANAAARLAARRPARFRFRGVSPLISGEPAEMRLKRDGDAVRCCMCDAAGLMTMQAEVG